MDFVWHDQRSPLGLFQCIRMNEFVDEVDVSPAFGQYICIVGKLHSFCVGFTRLPLL